MKPVAVTASALGLSRNEAGRRFPHAESGSALEELRASEVITPFLSGTFRSSRMRTRQPSMARALTLLMPFIRI